MLALFFLLIVYNFGKKVNVVSANFTSCYLRCSLATTTTLAGCCVMSVSAMLVYDIMCCFLLLSKGTCQTTNYVIMCLSNIRLQQI